MWGLALPTCFGTSKDLESPQSLPAPGGIASPEWCKPYMRISIVISFLFLLTDFTFSQDKGIGKPSFDDTTLVRTDLIDTFKVNDRIICFRSGKNAIIYLSGNSILDTVLKGLISPYDYERRNSNLINEFLSQYSNSDTIFLEDYPYYFEYLVSGQLKKGNARIFDRKTNLFVPFIYQRLERVISTADRVYYFVDHRRFFQVQEWSGILPNELMPDIE